MLVAACLVVTGSARAQERTASQNYDAQINWTTLVNKIDALDTQNKALASSYNKMLACNTKMMVYAPSSPNKDADGCVSIASGMYTDSCYFTYANRFGLRAYCEKDYYIKGIIKDTNKDWDGIGMVCCYTKPGNGPVKSYGAPLTNPTRWPATKFNNIAAECQYNPHKFGENDVICPFPE